MAETNAAREESFGCAMRLVMGSVLPMTLQAANDLGIFAVIAEAGRDAKLGAPEIASKLSSKNPDADVMVDRILKLLATHSVVDCILDDQDGGSGGQHRLYSLNSVSRYFVKNEDGVSLAPMMSLIQDKVFLDSWPELRNTVLEGGVPFDRVHGSHAFEYQGLDPRFNRVFNAAMFNHTSIVITEVLNCYTELGQLELIVDVGGGLGHTIKAITSKYPNVKGINFDLPHVIRQAPSIPGVENVAGDMFESVPQGGAVFMKWILHDWSDERCLKLLENCYKAIPKEGKVIVLEAVVPFMAENSTCSQLSTALDVFMMTQNPGGKERTKEEFLDLATRSGFRGIDFKYCVYNFWVMEFFK